MYTDEVSYPIAFSEGCDYIVREIKIYRLKFHHSSKERRVIDNLIKHLEKDNKEEKHD
jgi:uncharacterized protein YihD (DUF1040 family)